MKESELRLHIKESIYDVVKHYYDEYNKKRSLEVLDKFNKAKRIYEKIRNIDSLIDISLEINDLEELTYDPNNSDIEVLSKIVEAYHSVINGEYIPLQQNHYNNINMSANVSKQGTITQGTAAQNPNKQAANTQGTGVQNPNKQATNTQGTGVQNPNKQAATITPNSTDIYDLLMQYDEKIRLLYDKLDILDTSSPEAKDIRIELYNLIEERNKKILESVDEANQIEVKNMLSELDSLEKRISTLPEGEKLKDTYMLLDDYKKDLEDRLKELASLEFYGIKSPEFEYNFEATDAENEREFNIFFNRKIGEFQSLIHSISGKTSTDIIMSDNPEENISTDNLLSYLRIYNLNGKYGDFKSKNEGAMIGNRKVTKDMYEDEVSQIKEIIGTLIEQSCEKVKQNGGKIDYIDVTPYKSDIITDIKNMIAKISNKMTKNISKGR